MTWTCPACQLTIQHTGDFPRAGTVYRCHVCHLELVLDGDGDELTLLPFLKTGNVRAQDTEQRQSPTTQSVPPDRQKKIRTRSG